MLTVGNNNKQADANTSLLLNNIVNNDIGWVTQNTAILVVHGIGYQLPLETLDQFGRGLVKQYKQAFQDELKLEQELVSKSNKNNKKWFDNVLRISKENSPYHIDVYEYYWANYTEDKATFSDINKWLQGVVKGAKKFYKRNGQLGKLYKDHSIFFNTQTGNFIAWRYSFFLSVMSQLIYITNQLMKLFVWLLNRIPFAGRLAGKIVESYEDTITQNISNLLVDVVAYNVADPKSKFYAIRSLIADGAVKALQYLLEKVHRKDDMQCECELTPLLKKYRRDIQFAKGEEKDKIQKQLNHALNDAELSYPSVIVAAHSLGTQIAYDAINEVNLKINKGQIATYDDKGKCKVGDKKAVSKQLSGFVTFGSPLDKTLFFLRENIPDDYYLRQQFLNNLHSFKMHNLDIAFNNLNTNKAFVKADCGLIKFFEQIQWRNYHDDKDYISGGLDYYTGLINVNCQFKASILGFTHSYYWECDKFYVDIINNFLN